MGLSSIIFLIFTWIFGWFWGDFGKKFDPYSPGNYEPSYPIGFPAILCMYSFIMWTMYSCGMLLRAAGYKMRTWLDQSYPGLLPADEVLPRPPKSKKQPRDKRKLFLLGLAAALSIANTLPRIEMGKARGLRRHLRQFKKQGILNTKRVKWEDLEQV